MKKISLLILCVLVLLLCSQVWAAPPPDKGDPWEDLKQVMSGKKESAVLKNVTEAELDRMILQIAEELTGEIGIPGGGPCHLTRDWMSNPNGVGGSWLVCCSCGEGAHRCWGCEGCAQHK